MTINAPQAVTQAEARIRPYIRETLLDHSPYYSQTTGANVYFKCENLQHTGSFKARGALNKVLALSEADRALGIVTASTGNHGAACAFAMQKVGAKGIVFVPETAAETKVSNIQRRGAETRAFGTDGLDTELHARQYAADNGMTFISPYNDIDVLGGQGTIGIELLRQLPALDAVFVAVGGGGLMGGISSYIKSVKPSVEVVGCSPLNSRVMEESVKAGKVIELESLPTLSDGTAGGVELDSVTFPLCRDNVDRFVAVTEAEIAESMRTFMNTQHMMIEGAAAVPIAALMQDPSAYAGKNVAIVLCGANISLSVLAGVLQAAA